MFNKVCSKFERYKLSILAGTSLVLFLLLIFWTFFQLASSSIDKSRLIREELFDRDLRELIGHFDSDERYVLEKNLTQFLSEQRLISPLLLPRQYYVALPSGSSKFTPRPPPRNCFVDLIKSESISKLNQKFPDKFCSYFAENKNVGTYLFFSMEYVDPEINPLRTGDTTFDADSVNITIENGLIRNSWSLLFQSPKNLENKDRFQLTAFREKTDGVRELDKRIEGWAYVQRQANNSTVVNLIARLDFKEFYSNRENEIWPPMNWERTKIQISRNDISWKNNLLKIQYKDIGNSNLSIPSLSSPIFNAYASLNVKTGKTSWPVSPSGLVKPKLKDSTSFIRFVDGDLLIRQSPIVRSQLLQDTSISFEVNHPGAVIEKSIWRTAIYIVILLLGFLDLAAFFFFRLLKPIWTLSRHSRQLIKQNSNRSDLPYSNRNDEIGALSKGFNELLRETREQSAREHEDREKRSEELRKKHTEDVRNREINLQVIGHEIRSPLQALKSLHTEQSKSWRYIERITQAVTQLFGASAPETAFSLREINLEQLDLGKFLFEVAQNSPLANIPNVLFEGPNIGLLVNVDSSVLEDALTNILNNGNRYRKENSPLLIKLSHENSKAIISISNDGPHIPEDTLEQIFELYFSTENISENDLHGIGLYAAKSYITRMDGSISAENDSNGVNFIISLPLISLVHK